MTGRINHYQTRGLVDINIGEWIEQRGQIQAANGVPPTKKGGRTVLELIHDRSGVCSLSTQSKTSERKNRQVPSVGLECEHQR